MRSSSSLLSPPPTPHPVPLPVSSPSSSLACCPELDLSVTCGPGHAGTQNPPLDKSDQSEPCARGETGRRRVRFEEPMVATGAPNSLQTQQSVRGQRRSRGRHHAPRQCMERPAVASNQDPGCLERVELNSTLALKAELQSLQEAEFDSQKAVQESLWRSARTKNLINTRATEVVNVSRSQLLYTSLVSVDVQEDQLISQALQDKLLLAPTPHFHGSRTADGPSRFLFMTSDLLRQKPLPLEEEPVNIKPCPSTHHARSTFDLYRRQRCHDAMT